MNLPNAHIEGTPLQNTESRAMKALERVTNKAPVETIPDVPVVKPPMKGETPPVEESDDYDIGEPIEKEPQASDVDDVDRIIDIKGTSAENMKRLRYKLKGTHSELQAAKTQLETLQQKVSQYESGHVVPEEIATLQSRIEELEPFQKIYSLETSPAYLEAVAKPREAIKNELVTLANDYKVSLEILDEAVSATNRAERNRLLGQHFDEVGALEAKSLITKLVEIGEKDVEYRKEPSAAMARLHATTQASLEAKRKSELDSITSVSKSAWSESLIALREEDHVALSFKDGDTEHNETIVRPLLNKASKDFGAVVKILAENGLKQLPQETSYIIARAIQLSHESAVLRLENSQIKEELQTLRRRVGDLNSLNRPGASGGGSSSNAGQREKGGVGAARAALAKVTSK